MNELNKRCPYLIPTIGDIVKLIEAKAYRYNKERLISDVFEAGAIEISNAVDFAELEKKSERIKRILKGYDEDGQAAMREIFGKIFALLSSVVYEDGVFNDYLGELFMKCELGDKHNGQFFTPYHISQLMAKITIEEDMVREKQRRNEVLTLNDPCCGAGGLLIAALDVLRDYGLNYAHNCYIEANDIDARCVHMTYLQLSLAGVPAVVRHQNTITQEVWSTWRTPALMLQYPRFRIVAEQSRRGV